MANQAETDLSLPLGQRGILTLYRVQWRLKVVSTSQIQETWPRARGKQGAGSKTSTSLEKPQGSFFFFFPGHWMAVVRGGGRGFPVRNQTSQPVQSEIQTYTILK